MNNLTVLKNIFTKKSGFNFFKFGLLTLPSLPLLGSILLFIAAIIGSQKRSDYFLKDKYNFPFLLIGILMLLSCITQIFIPRDNVYSEWDYSLAFISLFNWLPFFWVFWSFKTFLINPKERQICTVYFTIGIIPLIFSCICQYWFEWYGPFGLFNNLIVWFQKPICSGKVYEECVTGVTGFFNNPNVAGSYFTMIMPFTIALLINKFKRLSNSKYLYLSIFISIIFFTFLTNSRNAWLGMIIIFILFNRFWLSIFLLFILFALFPIIINNFELFPHEIKDYIFDLIPYTTKQKFSTLSLDLLNNMHRLTIYKTSLLMIISKPFFGWGASIYPIFYLLRNEEYAGHSHNLFFELAINYGLPVSIIFIAFLAFLLKKSIDLNNKNTNKTIQIFDQAWYISTIVFIISHLFDVQYFDLRISITFWIVLSGIRAIIFEEEENLKTKDRIIRENS